MKKPMFATSDRNAKSRMSFRLSPEEYAAMWGCDGRYDTHPNKHGDGVLFYNFSSEHQPRTDEWLSSFLGAIERTLLKFEVKEVPKDKKDLTRLKKWVIYLLTLPENDRRK